METRHPIGGSFGISASVIIAELCQPEVARLGNFVSNFCVRRLAVKFSKFCSESFHRCCVKCRKIHPTGNRWNRALFTWKKKIRLPLKLSLLRRSRPKSAKASLRHFGSDCSIFHSNKSVYFRRSYSRTHQGRFCPIEYVYDRIFEPVIIQSKFALQSMCKHIVDSTRRISEDMWNKKVSNSKSDLQGHSRSLVMVPFVRPHAISY